MGIGPAVAIPAAVKSAGLELGDIDLYEINEVVAFFDGFCFEGEFDLSFLPFLIMQYVFFDQAFASQFVYSCKKLELDQEKVNVNGGAIALGHPLGVTGTYLTVI